MKTYQPYTYLIKIKPTEQLYYGAKTAKGCHPDQLWVKYFTSSKVVAKLIKEYGKDSFEIVSIKLHETRIDALKHEELYLVSVNAGYNTKYLNKHNGAKNFTTSGMSGENHHGYGIKHTKEQNKAQSERMSGENHHGYGKKHSDEWKNNQSKNNGMLGKTGELCPNYGRKNTNETKELMKINSGKLGTHPTKETLKLISDGHKKKYIVIFPDSHEEFIIGMKEFCIKNKLNVGNMNQVAKGRYKTCKKFKCRYATEEETLTYLNQTDIIIT
jgi:hypothetical protein